MGKVNVNLHGHLYPDFGPWWMKRCGAESKNPAVVVADICLERGLNIQAVTNESDIWKFGEKSRFSYMREFALMPSATSQYRFGELGKNAFLMERSFGENSGKRIIFLNGKAIRVEDSLLRKDKRKYEVVSWGSEEIPNGMSFHDTSNYLDDNGLMSTLEHALSMGHYGPMTEEEISLLWVKKYIRSVEWNSKIAVPNLMTAIPIPELRGFARNCNTRLEKLAKKIGIPMTANSDDDKPPHIAIAYNIFDRDKVNLNSDVAMVQDINSLVRNNEFETHKDYLGPYEFFKYAAWETVLLSQKLHLPEKYDARHAA